MALCLAARQCTKLGGIPRVVTQLRPIQSIKIPNLLPTAKNCLKKETNLVRNFSLTSAKLSAAHGNHSILWTVERALSLLLLGVVPAAIAFPSQALDYTLAVSVVMHAHWGLEAVVVDYVRPLIFGNTIPKIARASVYGLSALTLAGLFYFIYNDIGIGAAVHKLWAIKPAK